MKRARAVIAINSGNVILIDCWFQKTNQYRVLDVEADNEKDAIKKAIKIADTAKIGRITPRDVFNVSKPYDEEVELDELRVTNTTTKKLKMYYDKFKKAVTPREKSILSNISKVSNAPGVVINPGQLAYGLQMLAAGKDIDYQGATDVEFNVFGDADGAFKELEVSGGTFVTVGAL